MIAIKKSEAPPELIALQKESVEQGLTANAAYDTLRNPLKKQVTEQLMRDQGHLCAYCMRKIPDERKGLPHVKIEHWEARNGENGETCGPYGALHYHNFLAVCSGNQNGRSERNDRSERKEEKLTCDVSRGNKKLVVNPLDASTLLTIYYTEDGFIYAKDETIHHDLTVTLNLNCERDTVRLPQERKSVLNEIQAYVYAEMDAGNEPLNVVANLYQELLAIDDKKTPYIGISLWWLKDMIDTLSDE